MAARPNECLQIVSFVSCFTSFLHNFYLLCVSSNECKQPHRHRIETVYFDVIRMWVTESCTWAVNLPRMTDLWCGPMIKTGHTFCLFTFGFVPPLHHHRRFRVDYRFLFIFFKCEIKCVTKASPRHRQPRFISMLLGVGYSLSVEFSLRRFIVIMTEREKKFAEFASLRLFCFPFTFAQKR